MPILMTLHHCVKLELKRNFQFFFLFVKGNMECEKSKNSKKYPWNFYPAALKE